MPWYFFSVTDALMHPDVEGRSLRGMAEARSEALRIAGRALDRLGDGFWRKTDWRLTVTNDAGLQVLTLGLRAEERFVP
jgi:hypothetical protein